MAAGNKKLVVKKKDVSSVKTEKQETEQILAALKRSFRERDTKWKLRRRVRMREEDPPVPEAYQNTSLKHKSSELNHMVRQVVAILAENKEQYIVYAPKDNEDTHRLADETSRAIAALMEMLEDQHPIERPRPLCHDYQVADGVAIEKITFDWEFYQNVIDTKGETSDWKDAFTTYVRENRKLPIRRIVIDPLQAYWEFDLNGLSAVAEEAQVRLSALKDTYGNDTHVMNMLTRIPMVSGSGDGTMNISTDGGSDSYSDQGDLVKVIEIWTRKEFMVIAEGGGGEKQLLVRQPHPFKRPPYFFAAGLLTGSSNPLHKFQPLVLAMYPLALELSAVRTARLNAAFLSSFKPFYIKYGATGGVEMDEAAGGIKIHFLTPGNSIPSIKGGEIVPIDWTNLDELTKLEQSLMGDRDRFGFQAILAGNQAASGDSTAWATRMLRDQGMVQFNQVLKNYAQMREEEIRFILFIVEKIIKDDLPVTRREIEPRTKKATLQTLYITPEMAAMGFDIQVRLSAGKASDRISIVEEFRRAHEAGEVPMRMVLEEGWQFQNVTEIMDEVVDEQIRQQLIPDAIKMIMETGVAGALTELQKYLPKQPPPDPTQMGAVGPQGPTPGAPGPQGNAAPIQTMQPGQPPGGELPAGIAEAGMGQSLVPQNIPPEQSQQPLVQR